MKTFLLKTTFLCLAAVSHPALAQEKKQEKPPVISFAFLKANQRITVDYESQGCFNHDHFVLTYTNQPQSRFEVDKLDKFDKLKAAVSPKQITQLDNLLKFYRRPKSGNCSTIDHIKVMLMQQDKVLASEIFVDKSGFTTLIPTLLQDAPELLKKAGFTKEDIASVRNIVTLDHFFEAAK